MPLHLADVNKIKWNVRSPKLNWARRISWRWWDEWDHTALQTQESKFEPCPSILPLGHGAPPPIVLIFYEWARKKKIVSLKPEGKSWVRTHDLRLSKQAALTTAPGPPPLTWTPLPSISYSEIQIILLLGRTSLCHSVNNRHLRCQRWCVWLRR